MAAVARKFDRVVLDNILLDNSVAARTLQFGLLKCFLVEVTLRNVAIVARDVCSDLGCTYR